MCLKNYIAALYNINVQENISDFLKSLIKGDWRNSYSGEWCGPWASNANVTSMLIRLKKFRKIKKTNTISSLYFVPTCKDVGFKLWYLPRVRYEIVLQKYRNPFRPFREFRFQYLYVEIHISSKGNYKLWFRLIIVENPQCFFKIKFLYIIATLFEVKKLYWLAAKTKALAMHHCTC